LRDEFFLVGRYIDDVLMACTPTLFIDGIVHRGSYDAAALLQALTR
jgi:hypothetical protein